jgi:UDP-N-acetylmuramate: L-alanyl-gamma-D-glutamyl-meso-diaminopimelate ligase
MGGLAILARESGHRVTGCDAGVYPPMSDQLRAQGIQLIDGYGLEQLELQPDLFVIGNAMTRGNPLVEAILERGLRYTSGPQWLGEHILADKWVLAVAGTHGKTTTSAMLAWLLEDAGLNPGFLIGGVPLNFGVSARLTDSRFFVIEADEYDTAFFDKRSKFLHYRPRTVILNNLEYDHADIFPDLAAIETQFHHLVRIVPQSGRLIVNGADAALARVLARGCWSEVEPFDVAQGWQAVADSASALDQRFNVVWQGQPAGTVEWDVQGAHNRSNAVAALAAARHVGVPPLHAAAALAQFRNVKRRMEVRGCVEGITVYDDFAHHPSAIKATLDGLRARLDGMAAASTGRAARILAVFEARSNTMKLGIMKAALPDSLNSADQVFGYSAPSGQHTANWNLGETLSPLGACAQVFNDLDRLVDAVCAAARSGDQIVVMSNGSFGGIHQKLLDNLRKV